MHSFKIGDLVQPTKDVLSTHSGYFAERDNANLPLTVTEVYRPIHGGTYVRWRDAHGNVGTGFEPHRFEPYVAPKANPVSVGKHWLIAVIDKGDLKPRPNSPPRLYISAEQARAVARSMAEKNRAETFIVYEATDVIVAPPVSLPETQHHKL